MSPACSSATVCARCSAGLCRPGRRAARRPAVAGRARRDQPARSARDWRRSRIADRRFACGDHRPGAAGGENGPGQPAARGMMQPAKLHIVFEQILSLRALRGLHECREAAVIRLRPAVDPRLPRQRKRDDVRAGGDSDVLPAIEDIGHRRRLPVDAFSWNCHSGGPSAASTADQRAAVVAEEHDPAGGRERAAPGSRHGRPAGLPTRSSPVGCRSRAASSAPVRQAPDASHPRSTSVPAARPRAIASRSCTSRAPARSTGRSTALNDVENQLVAPSTAGHTFVPFRGRRLAVVQHGPALARRFRSPTSTS